MKRTIALLSVFAAVFFAVSVQSYPVRTLDMNKPKYGFRHPGLLHTAEDFDRIRRQLAEKHPQVTEAYRQFCANQFAQSTVNDPTPTAEIRRGGGTTETPENYMSAARAAAIAYQNGLRWQIDRSEAHARKAVEVLNKWAATTKTITGDSNFALGAGLYGYEFANAAELVRDYPGWAEADIRAFKEWLLSVWYPASLDFLIRRNDTWANPGSSVGQRPGHYWSNWGLCNALTLMSIGIFCDDVLIYNQGVSFFKYDHTGTSDPSRQSYLTNHGLNEYIGNLVPRLSSDSRAPGGSWGQMQESGRDQGHSLLAVGLACDLCQTAWNQGDDLFGLMECRLAKGIEYVAAYNFGGVEDLPYYPYHYATRWVAWRNAENQSEISASGRGGVRPIWGRVLAHYQGVKGIDMTYSRMALAANSIDGGAAGTVSGGYDHLGYTVLLCTPESGDLNAIPSADKLPTPLVAQLRIGNSTLDGCEYGGRSHSANNPQGEAAAGASIVLSPSVASGSADSGNWKWNTGETTREITVEPHRAAVYRVVYTNANGVTSTQHFTIAAVNDGTDPDAEESPVENLTQSKPYANLVDALNEAEDGDEVVVRTNQVLSDRYTLTKAVYMHGATGNEVISSSFNNKLIMIVGDRIKGDLSARIADLVFTGNGKTFTSSFFENKSKNLTLENVTFRNITTSHVKGVMGNNSGGISTLRNVRFENCEVTGQNSPGLIYFSKGGGVILQGEIVNGSVTVETPGSVIQVAPDFLPLGTLTTLASDTDVVPFVLSADTDIIPLDAPSACAADIDIAPFGIWLQAPSKGTDPQWTANLDIVTGTTDDSLFDLNSDDFQLGANPAGTGLRLTSRQSGIQSLPLADPDNANDFDNSTNSTEVPEYYDLTGRRVAAPTSGLYIERRASTSRFIAL